MLRVGCDAEKAGGGAAFVSSLTCSAAAFSAGTPATVDDSRNSSSCRSHSCFRNGSRSRGRDAPAAPQQEGHSCNDGAASSRGLLPSPAVAAATAAAQAAAEVVAEIRGRSSIHQLPPTQSIPNAVKEEGPLRISAVLALRQCLYTVRCELSCAPPQWAGGAASSTSDGEKDEAAANCCLAVAACRVVDRSRGATRSSSGDNNSSDGSEARRSRSNESRCSDGGSTASSSGNSRGSSSRHSSSSCGSDSSSSGSSCSSSSSSGNSSSSNTGNSSSSSSGNSSSSSSENSGSGERWEVYAGCFPKGFIEEVTRRTGRYLPLRIFWIYLLQAIHRRIGLSTSSSLPLAPPPADTAAAAGACAARAATGACGAATAGAAPASELIRGRAAGAAAEPPGGAAAAETGGEANEVIATLTLWDKSDLEALRRARNSSNGQESSSSSSRRRRSRSNSSSRGESPAADSSASAAAAEKQFLILTCKTAGPRGGRVHYPLALHKIFVAVQAQRQQRHQRQQQRECLQEQAQHCLDNDSCDSDRATACEGKGTRPQAYSSQKKSSDALRRRGTAAPFPLCKVETRPRSASLSSAAAAAAKDVGRPALPLCSVASTVSHQAVAAASAEAATCFSFSPPSTPSSAAAPATTGNLGAGDCRRGAAAAAGTRAAGTVCFLPPTAAPEQEEKEKVEKKHRCGRSADASAQLQPPGLPNGCSHAVAAVVARCRHRVAEAAGPAAGTDQGTAGAAAVGWRSSCSSDTTALRRLQMSRSETRSTPRTADAAAAGTAGLVSCCSCGKSCKETPRERLFAARMQQLQTELLETRRRLQSARCVHARETLLLQQHLQQCRHSELSLRDRVRQLEVALRLDTSRSGAAASSSSSVRRAPTARGRSCSSTRAASVGETPSRSRWSGRAFTTATRGRTAAARSPTARGLLRSRSQSKSLAASSSAATLLQLPPEQQLPPGEVQYVRRGGGALVPLPLPHLLLPGGSSVAAFSKQQRQQQTRLQTWERQLLPGRRSLGAAAATRAAASQRSRSWDRAAAVAAATAAAPPRHSVTSPGASIFAVAAAVRARPRSCSSVADRSTRSPAAAPAASGLYPAAAAAASPSCASSSSIAASLQPAATRRGRAQFYSPRQRPASSMTRSSLPCLRPSRQYPAGAVGGAFTCSSAAGTRAAALSTAVTASCRKGVPLGRRPAASAPRGAAAGESYQLSPQQQQHLRATSSCSRRSSSCCSTRLLTANSTPRQSPRSVLRASAAAAAAKRGSPIRTCAAAAVPPPIPFPVLPARASPSRLLGRTTAQPLPQSPQRQPQQQQHQKFAAGDRAATAEQEALRLPPRHRNVLPPCLLQQGMQQQESAQKETQQQLWHLQQQGQPCQLLQQEQWWHHRQRLQEQQQQQALPCAEGGLLWKAGGLRAPHTAAAIAANVSGANTTPSGTAARPATLFQAPPLRTATSSRPSSFSFPSPAAAVPQLQAPAAVTAEKQEAAAAAAEVAAVLQQSVQGKGSDSLVMIPVEQLKCLLQQLPDTAAAVAAGSRPSWWPVLDKTVDSLPSSATQTVATACDGVESLTDTLVQKQQRQLQQQQQQQHEQHSEHKHRQTLTGRWLSDFERTTQAAAAVPLSAAARTDGLSVVAAEMMPPQVNTSSSHLLEDGSEAAVPSPSSPLSFNTYRKRLLSISSTTLNLHRDPSRFLPLLRQTGDTTTAFLPTNGNVAPPEGRDGNCMPLIPPGVSAAIPTADSVVAAFGRPAVFTGKDAAAFEAGKTAAARAAGEAAAAAFAAGKAAAAAFAAGKAPAAAPAVNSVHAVAGFKEKLLTGRSGGAAESPAQPQQEGKHRRRIFLLHSDTDNSTALKNPGADEALPSGRETDAAVPPPLQLGMCAGSGTETLEAKTTLCDSSLSTAHGKNSSNRRAPYCSTSSRATRSAGRYTAGSNNSVTSSILWGPAKLTATKEWKERLHKSSAGETLVSDEPLQQERAAETSTAPETGGEDSSTSAYADIDRRLNALQNFLKSTRESFKMLDRGSLGSVGDEGR